MIQQIQINDEHVFVVLAGTIFLSEAAKIKQKLFPYAQQGKKFVIHLSGVENMDSAGFGVLAALKNITRETGGSVILTGLSDSVKEILQVKQITEIFQIE